MSCAATSAPAPAGPAVLIGGFTLAAESVNRYRERRLRTHRILVQAKVEAERQHEYSRLRSTVTELYCWPAVGVSEPVEADANYDSFIIKLVSFI